MISKQVAEYLAAQGLGTVGTNIFYEFLPSSPDLVTSVVITGGFEDSASLPFDTPTIQIRTRGSDTSEAFSRITAIYNVLNGLKRTTLVSGGYLVNLIRALQSYPESIGRDDSNRPEYTINFAVEIMNPTVYRT